jgi:hypothetical protein
VCIKYNDSKGEVKGIRQGISRQFIKQDNLREKKREG